MNHLKKAHDFINKISELIAKFQFEFKTHQIRSQMCYELKSLFDIEFDEYWQKISGLYPSDLNFLDITTPEVVDQGQYHIGVSIKNGETIPFSDFITEHFGIEAVRDRKIKEILGF